jgi:hypothetical protein
MDDFAVSLSGHEAWARYSMRQTVHRLALTLKLRHTFVRFRMGRITGQSFRPHHPVRNVRMIAIAISGQHDEGVVTAGS